MNGTARAGRYAYARGEDVVAQLGGTPAYHIRGGGQLSDTCVPAWTIGRIIGARRAGDQPAYLLLFQHDGDDCVCWVAEAAIDGVC